MATVSTITPVVNNAAPKANGAEKKPTYAELQAKLAELEGRVAAAEAKKEQRITLKVSEKKALSVYGLGRWPVTLYKSQWLTLLSIADSIREFITAHDKELAVKE